MKLAQEYFRSIEETNRLEEMLSEKIADLVGAIETDSVDFLPFDDAVLIQYAANSLAVTPEAQTEIYALGFKRIFIHHQNGLETFYYEGGDPRGKTGLRP
jgi:hypothetical protein